MAASTINPSKKRGRPEVDSEQVNLRLPRDLLDALDRYMLEEKVGVTRAHALRTAFRDWAIAHGYLENPPDREDAN